MTSNTPEQNYSEYSLPAAALSVQEDVFLHAWKESRRHEVAKTALIAVSCFALFSALFYNLANDVTNDGGMLIFGQLFLLISATSLFVVRTKISKMVLRVVTSVMVWMQMAFTLLYLVESGHGETALLLPLSLSMLATCCFVMLYPADRFSLTVMVFANLAVAGTGMYRNGSGLSALFVYSMFTFFIFVLRLYFDYRQRLNGVGEFRYRMLCAPPHLVIKGAGESFEDSIENFMPENVFCVCLATDWRQYFPKHSLSPSQVAMSISEFYDLCERLLRVCLPRGNYFADWIADELCLTIYQIEDKGQIDRKQLVASAIDFASRLVAARGEFTRMHGVPQELDLGISSGEAIIGMMGPESHKKATALGEIPGRARRIYGAGRLLRMILGAGDKIIFDAQTAALINFDAGEKRVVLSHGQSIRDFPDREVFVIIPEPADHFDRPGRRSGVA